MAEYGGYNARPVYQNAPGHQSYRPPAPFAQPKSYTPPPVVDAPGRPMDTPTCNCGQQAVRKVAGPNAQNPGKEFFCCPNPKESTCGYFQWTDGTPSTKRQRVAPSDGNLLPFLTERLNSVEAKLDTLLSMMSGNLNGPQSMAENFQQHQ